MTDQVATKSAQAAARYIPIPVVNEVVSYLIGLVGIKGKTHHMTYEQTDPLAKRLGRSIADYLGELIDASTIAALRNQLATLAANSIGSNSWWKVGNDQWPNMSAQIMNPSPVRDAYDTIWRVLFWSFINAPNDNFADAYYSSRDVFDASLYKLLRSSGFEVALPVIDGLIARTAKEGSTGTVTPAIVPKYGSLTGELTTGSGSGSIVDKISDAVSSIFGGSSEASGIKKAAMSTPMIVLITGAVVGIIYLGYQRLKS